MGITVAACAVGAYVGGTNFITAFGQGALSSQLVQAATNIGVRNLGMDATGAQIFGYAVTGALSGATTALSAGDAYHPFNTDT